MIYTLDYLILNIYCLKEEEYEDEDKEEEEDAWESDGFHNLTFLLWHLIQIYIII
jgi:hypothetical protein